MTVGWWTFCTHSWCYDCMCVWAFCDAEIIVQQITWCTICANHFRSTWWALRWAVLTNTCIVVHFLWAIKYAQQVVKYTRWTAETCVCSVCTSFAWGCAWYACPVQVLLVKTLSAVWYTLVCRVEEKEVLLAGKTFSSGINTCFARWDTWFTYSIYTNKL